MRECILHAVLKAGNLVLMATDMVDEVELVRGNNMSIMIECSTEDEVKIHYKNLSAGGKVNHPVVKNIWGAIFGGLTDRYGHQWLFHCHQNDHSKTSI
jgi:PhnB protein